MAADKQQTLSRRLWIAGVVIAVAAAGLLRARYGISLTDEGSYLTAPFRFIMGDMPLRDDSSSVGTWYFIFLEPFMKFLPHAGTVLFFRCAGVIFHVLCLWALFEVFAKKIPLPALLAAFAAAAYVNIYGIWTPGYNAMSADFGFLCLAFWLKGLDAESSRPAALNGAIAGVMLGLAIICYLPCIALLGAPAALALHRLIRRNRSGHAFACHASFLAAAAAMCVLIVAYLAAAGLLDDFFNGFRLARTSTDFNFSPIEKFKYLLSLLNSMTTPGLALGHLFFWSLGVYFVSRRRAGFGAAAGIIATAAVYALFLYSAAPWHSVESLCVASVLAFALARPRTEAHRREFSLQLAALLVFGVLWQFAVGMASGNMLATATYTMCPLFIALVVTFYCEAGARAGRRMSRETASRWSAAAAAALCIAVAVNVTGACFVHTYMDDTPRNLTRRMQTGRLRGIYTTPEKAALLEAVLAYFEPRLTPGEFFLAYENIPMMYYLTGTRPAMTIVDSSKYLLPPRTRDSEVRLMIERRRIPRYALRMNVVPESAGKPQYPSIFAQPLWLRPLLHPERVEHPATPERMPFSTNPTEDPVNFFVTRNYILEKSIGPFDIFVLRGPAPAHDSGIPNGSNSRKF